MSSCFYLLEHAKPAYDESGRPVIPRHNKLGAREEAGWYCVRDALTLCQAGPDNVHQPGAAWFDACPKCEAEAGDKTGPIRWAHSFTWDLPPGAHVDLHTHGPIGKLAKAIHDAETRGPGWQPIIDDTGNLYSIDEFFALVGSCEFQFNKPVLL